MWQVFYLHGILNSVHGSLSASIGKICSNILPSCWQIAHILSSSVSVSRNSFLKSSYLLVRHLEVECKTFSTVFSWLHWNPMESFFAVSTTTCAFCVDEMSSNCISIISDEIRQLDPCSVSEPLCEHNVSTKKKIILSANSHLKKSFHNLFWFTMLFWNNSPCSHVEKSCLCLSSHCFSKHDFLSSWRSTYRMPSHGRCSPTNISGTFSGRITLSFSKGAMWSSLSPCTVINPILLLLQNLLSVYKIDNIIPFNICIFNQHLLLNQPCQVILKNKSVIDWSCYPFWFRFLCKWWQVSLFMSEFKRSTSFGCVSSLLARSRRDSSVRLFFQIVRGWQVTFWQSCWFVSYGFLFWYVGLHYFIIITFSYCDIICIVCYHQSSNFHGIYFPLLNQLMICYEHYFEQWRYLGLAVQLLPQDLRSLHLLQTVVVRDRARLCLDCCDQCMQNIAQLHNLFQSNP